MGSLVAEIISYKMISGSIESSLPPFVLLQCRDCGIALHSASLLPLSWAPWLASHNGSDDYEQKDKRKHESGDEANYAYACSPVISAPR